MNVSSDLLIMAMPLIMIRQIQIRSRERWAIMFLLFLGGGMVITTLTCCALHITYRQHLVVYYSFLQTASLLALVELSVAVSAVSLPSLRAVLYRRREELRRKSAATYTGSGSGGSGLTSYKNAVRGREEGKMDGLDEEVGAEEEEDTSQLVILRRLSYDVHSQNEVGKERVEVGRGV